MLQRQLLAVPSWIRQRTSPASDIAHSSPKNIELDKIISSKNSFFLMKCESTCQNFVEIVTHDANHYKVDSTMSLEDGRNSSFSPLYDQVLSNKFVRN